MRSTCKTRGPSPFYLVITERSPFTTPKKSGHITKVISYIDPKQTVEGQKQSTLSQGFLMVLYVVSQGYTFMKASRKTLHGGFYGAS